MYIHSPPGVDTVAHGNIFENSVFYLVQNDCVYINIPVCILQRSCAH